MIKRTGFVSEALQGASYDTENGELTVTFSSGQAYSYENVPEEVWEAFNTASSPGLFWRTNIKGSF